MEAITAENTPVAATAVAVAVEPAASSIVDASIWNGISDGASGGGVVIEPDVVESGSYWDDPPEKELVDKTLSTIDLSALGSQKVLPKDDTKDGTTTTMKRTPSKHNYWDWNEKLDGMKSTLSNISLGALQRQGKGKGKCDKDDDGTTTENDKTTVNNNSQPSSSIPRRESGHGYWFWRNQSVTNLSSTDSLTSLEQHGSNSESASKDNNSTIPTTTATLPRKNSGTDYWLWRNFSSSNLGTTNVSNVSLNTLDKQVKDSTSTATSTADGPSGPISNLPHKLRSSWRNSFRQLSTNSMTKLDEYGATYLDGSRGKSTRGGGVGDGSLDGSRGKSTRGSGGGDHGGGSSLDNSRGKSSRNRSDSFLVEEGDEGDDNGAMVF
jgi:hypothetical protein